MGLDVNGFDNTPEWGYCKAPEGCKEEAFPIWKSGDYPDDPDLLLCPKHIGALIGRLEADVAALRHLLDRINTMHSLDDPMSDGEPTPSELIDAALTADRPGTTLLTELAAARALRAACQTLGSMLELSAACAAYDAAVKASEQ